MKKSIFLFVMTAALSLGMIVYGCIFTGSRVSKVTLTEETVTGDRKAADGLMVGFRADAGDDLHWINSYDYSSGETGSVFKRGEILEAAEPSIYDVIRRDKTFGKGDLTKTVKTLLYEDIRFTGWSAEPYTTKLKDDRLQGLQDKEIQDFYEEIQKRVVGSGEEEQGRIRLKDHLDYYPVSFRFRLGANRYDSGDALMGMKIYEEQGSPSPESAAVYDEDVELYTAFNTMFRIPVIDNEYQDYRISGAEDYDPETSLGYTAEVKKPSGGGEDYYEFDPIMVIQEESAEDGRNRMLFVVNNRTAKGAPVDVSQISGGYGVYELPIEVGTRHMKVGHRVVTVSDPTPMPDRMAMVYPLDEAAEYVEMSLSEDQRYLAVFSVKDGRYFVDVIDADTWSSKGPAELFPASEKMTYAWGEDGSLAVTNHRDYVAVLVRMEDRDDPYRVLYSGKVRGDLDEAFFDTEMVYKKNSYARYRYGIDEGLAIAAKDGKVALIQDQLVHLSDTSVRNASLECAVMDETGVIYRGKLNSGITDLGYGMSADEPETIMELSSDANAKTVNKMIQPVRDKNRAAWQ